MHDDLQEPYVGKLKQFPRMALVDRHHPEWLLLNEQIIDIDLPQHKEDLKSFRTQSLNWLITGNAGGLAFLLTYISLQNAEPSRSMILIPSFAAFFLGLIFGWASVFFASKEAESWIGFYLRHKRYHHALTLSQHEKPDITYYWKDANSYCEKIISSNTLHTRTFFSSCLGFIFGSCSVFAYLIFSLH